MSDPISNSLPDDLALLASQLRGLRPSAASIEAGDASFQVPRDQLMYRAGWAACETAHGWPTEDSVGNALRGAAARQMMPDLQGIEQLRVQQRRTSAAQLWPIATAVLLLISLTLGGLLLRQANEAASIAIVEQRPVAEISSRPESRASNLESQVPSALALQTPDSNLQPPASKLQPPAALFPSDNYLSLRNSVLLTGVEASAYRLPRATASATTHDATKRPVRPSDYRSLLQGLVGS